MVRKNGYKRITAMIPRTLKATKAVGKKTIKNVQYFLSKGVKSVSNVTNVINKRTAKTLRSLTIKKRR